MKSIFCHYVIVINCEDGRFIIELQRGIHLIMYNISVVQKKKS